MQAAWTTITAATVAIVRHREPQAPAAAIVHPKGRDPPPGGARARGPLQARALGPGRGRQAAGRVRLQCCVVSLVRVQSIGGHSVTTYEAEGNCVAAMRGGEQPEANEQPVG